METGEKDFTTERSLAWPRGCVPSGVTADGHVFAFWPQGGDQLRFVWDGVAGEPFAGPMEMRDGTTVFWSDDGRHIAYVGVRDGRPFVGRDGGEDPAFDDFSRSVPPVFSSGGVHLAYGAATNGDFRLIQDGEVVGQGSVAAVKAIFSPIGDRLAYVEMRSAGKHEHRIVLDGVAGPWFIGMRNAGRAMQFSPDGRRFAYYRIDGRGHGQWIVDGVGHPLVNDVRPISLAQIRGVGVLDPPLIALFSPDNRRFAYFGDVVGKGVAIVEDGVPGERFEAVGMPVFSPDSRHLAYTARTFGKSLTLVVDGIAGPHFPGTEGGSPVFSPDGGHVAAVLKRHEGGLFKKRRLYSVVLDGEVFPAHEGDDASAQPAISPDGSSVAWWLARGSDAFVMINGTRDPGAAVVSSDLLYTTSGHLMFAGLVGGSYTVVVDGRSGALADGGLVPMGPPTSWRSASAAFPFRVAPDGEHAAWAGAFDGAARPVFDDRVGPAFDQVLDWSIGEDGVATWLALRGDVIQRVTAGGRLGVVRQ